MEKRDKQLDELILGDAKIVCDKPECKDKGKYLICYILEAHPHCDEYFKEEKKRK